MTFHPSQILPHYNWTEADTANHFSKRRWEGEPKTQWTKAWVGSEGIINESEYHKGGLFYQFALSAVNGISSTSEMDDVQPDVGDEVIIKPAWVKEVLGG